MSGELQCASLSGLTLYAVIRSPTATVWDTGTSAFEAFTGANYANYAVAMTEQGTSGYYVGSMPVGITTRGAYSIDVRQQAGGSPAQGDTPILSGPLNWSGSAEQTAAQVALNGSGDVVASSVVATVATDVDSTITTMAAHLSTALPGVAAGTSGGLPTVNSSNEVAGVAAAVTVGGYASGEDPATALAAAGVTPARMEQLSAYTGTIAFDGVDTFTLTTLDGLHVFKQVLSGSGPAYTLTTTQVS